MSKRGFVATVVVVISLAWVGDYLTRPQPKAYPSIDQPVRPAMNVVVYAPDPTVGVFTVEQH